MKRFKVEKFLNGRSVGYATNLNVNQLIKILITEVVPELGQGPGFTYIVGEEDYDRLNKEGKVHRKDSEKDRCSRIGKIQTFHNRPAEGSG